MEFRTMDCAQAQNKSEGEAESRKVKENEKKTKMVTGTAITYYINVPRL